MAQLWLRLVQLLPMSDCRCQILNPTKLLSLKFVEEMIRLEKRFFLFLCILSKARNSIDLLQSFIEPVPFLSG